MNQPARYLSGVTTDNVKPLPQQNEAVILWAIVVHWWAWCRKQATPGWMITYFAIGVLVLVYALRLEAQAGELLRQCVGIQ